MMNYTGASGGTIKHRFIVTEERVRKGFLEELKFEGRFEG